MAEILLAEDSPTHTAMMKALLQQDGHTVRCVEDGQAAMEAVDQRRPHLIVTDLRMPRLNGMELTQEIVARYPKIPVVVVTARGSENLAVDALALGAANFVPKNSQRTLLNRVVRQTLRMAELDAQFDRFEGSLVRPEFKIELENDVKSIDAVVLLFIQTLAAAHRMNRTERIRVATSVSSALFNSVCFGNLEIKDDETVLQRMLAGEPKGLEEMRDRANAAAYRDRYVELKVSVGDDDTRVAVGHTGPGRFTRLTPAPGTPESFELEQCRGLMLMTSFMDDVIFHNGATRVVMVKHHPTAESSAA